MILSNSTSTHDLSQLLINMKGDTKVRKGDLENATKLVKCFAKAGNSTVPFKMGRKEATEIFKNLKEKHTSSNSGMMDKKLNMINKIQKKTLVTINKAEMNKIGKTIIQNDRNLKALKNNLEEKREAHRTTRTEVYKIAEGAERIKSGAGAAANSAREFKIESLKSDILNKFQNCSGLEKDLDRVSRGLDSTEPVPYGNAATTHAKYLTDSKSVIARFGAEVVNTSEGRFEERLGTKRIPNAEGREFIAYINEYNDLCRSRPESTNCELHDDAIGAGVTYLRHLSTEVNEIKNEIKSIESENEILKSNYKKLVDQVNS